VDVTGANGSIVVAEIGGPAVIRNRFGSIAASKIQGKTEISGGNGGIEVSEVTGDLKVTNSFGTVNASTVSGDVSIRNNNGAVILDGVSVVQDDHCDDDVFRTGDTWWRLRAGWWYRSGNWRGPWMAVDVRRVPARQIAVEVAQGSLEFGVLTFQPSDRHLTSLTIGTDELVMLMSPTHPLASRRGVSLEEFGRQPVVAHNDPSPARERVLRLFETRRVPLNILIALPSLDGIKRAVEMELGVALLPRRCALTEIASGRLVAVPVAQISRVRPLKLIYRRGVQLSHAASAFLAAAQEDEKGAVRRAKNAPQNPEM
jgi:hypothetical protein